MPDVDEATIEAESGLDYDYSMDYDYGLLQEVKRITVPTTTLSTTTPAPSVSGAGSASISVPTTTLATTTLAPTITGDGQASITVPTTALSLTTPTPSMAQAIGVPTTSLSVDTPDPTVTGDGQASISVAPTTLTTTTPNPTVTGAGSAPVSVPTSTLSLSTPAPGVVAAGSATIAVDATTLTLTNPAPRVGWGQWAIDGQPIGANTDEIATHRRLTLAQRVATATLTSELRPLKSDEGQVDVLATDSGGFTAVDRADGGNSYTVTPPVQRQPLRQTGTYHVERYEEDLVSQDVSEWDVSLDLVPASNRSDAKSISQTAASDEWALVTPNGTIATDSVDADFLGTGSDGVERFELTLRLTFEQSHAWESAFDRVEGVRVRRIPDATNVAVDDTSGNANTLTVTAPTAGDEVPQGDYVVTGWEGRRLNDAFGEYSVVIADAG